MKNKYFGVFLGICLMTLIYGFDMLTQSHINQQAEKDSIIINDLRALTTVYHVLPFDSGVDSTVEQNESIKQDVKKRHLIAVEINQSFFR